MAKLSAHKRTELYRLSKVTKEQAGSADEYEATRYYAVMSDKHVLKKTMWRNSTGKLDGTPWNDLGRLSGDISAYVEKLKTAGYSDARS